MVLLFRWLGRLGGVAVAVLFVLFWLHAPPHLPALGVRLRVQLLFLVMSVAAMLLGWWRERIGGAVSILALVGFLILEGFALGRIPTMVAVYAMMLPGLCLLEAASLDRSPTPDRPADIPAGGQMKIS